MEGAMKSPESLAGVATVWAVPPSRLYETRASRVREVAFHVRAEDMETDDPAS
jgi:hypothetical protein